MRREREVRERRSKRRKLTFEVEEMGFSHFF